MGSNKARLRVDPGCSDLYHASIKCFPIRQGLQKSACSRCSWHNDIEAVGLQAANARKGRMASRADTNTNRSRGRRERTSAGAILTAAMWHDTMLRLATALICDSMGQALKLVHAVCMEHTEPAKGTNRMNLLTASLGVKTLTTSIE